MTEFNDVSEHPDIILLQRKCAIGYCYLMIFNIIISAAMAWALFLGNLACLIFVCVLLAAHVCALFLAYRKPLYKWRNFAVALTLCVMIALIPIIIVAHTLGNETPYFWLLIPPLAYYIIYPTAKMSNIVIFLGSIIFLIVTIMIISVIIIIPVVAPYVKEWHIAVASNQLSLMQMLSMRYPVFAVPSFVFFFFYHMLIIAEAKAVIAVGSSTVRGYDPSMERFDEISIGKYYELYDSIVEYFEKDKPYLDPSFSLAQLSIHFNSNNAYVSRAVKLKRNMSFTTFVNSYRIEKVKELIRNSRDVYTFEHIYTAAGFVNQSTFNKAFKQIEGVTPSEFAAR